MSPTPLFLARKGISRNTSILASLAIFILIAVAFLRPVSGSEIDGVVTAYVSLDTNRDGVADKTVTVTSPKSTFIFKPPSLSTVELCQGGACSGDLVKIWFTVSVTAQWKGECRTAPVVPKAILYLNTNPVRTFPPALIGGGGNCADLNPGTVFSDASDPNMTVTKAQLLSMIGSTTGKFTLKMQVDVNVVMSFSDNTVLQKSGTGSSSVEINVTGATVSPSLDIVSVNVQGFTSS